VGTDTLDTTIILLPTTNDCRRGVVPPRYSKSGARFMIETLMLFAQLCHLRVCCQRSSFYLPIIALDVSPFRIEASGRYRLQIHKD
jgi:hypothetical protein